MMRLDHAAVGGQSGPLCRQDCYTELVGAQQPPQDVICPRQGCHVMLPRFDLVGQIPSMADQARGGFLPRGPRTW